MAQSGSGTSTPTGASGLCTLAACKTALSITDSAKDALVNDLIDAATKWANAYARRTLPATTHTETLSPGRDSRVRAMGTIIVPKEYPIISVTSLHEDTLARTFDADALIAGTDYVVSEAGYVIELLDDGVTRALTNGQRTAQLVYVAGYATIPADLARAGVMLVVHLWHLTDRQKQGIASETIGGHTLSYVNEEMPKEAKAILDGYVRPWGL